MWKRTLFNWCSKVNVNVSHRHMRQQYSRILLITLVFVTLDLAQFVAGVLAAYSSLLHTDYKHVCNQLIHPQKRESFYSKWKQIKHINIYPSSRQDCPGWHQPWWTFSSVPSLTDSLHSFASPSSDPQMLWSRHHLSQTTWKLGATQSHDASLGFGTSSLGTHWSRCVHFLQREKRSEDEHVFHAFDRFPKKGGNHSHVCV